MPTTFVTRAMTPPGIVTGAAYQDLDALGTPWFFDVPASGALHSAIYYDLDDEGLAMDLWLFSDRPTLTADNAPLALENGDAFKVLAVVQFTSFRDAANIQIAEATNIGRGYNLPSRRMWAQAQARGALNIAALNLPAFSISILPD